MGSGHSVLHLGSVCEHATRNSHPHRLALGPEERGGGGGGGGSGGGSGGGGGGSCFCYYAVLLLLLHHSLTSSSSVYIYFKLYLKKEFGVHRVLAESAHAALFGGVCKGYALDGPLLAFQGEPVFIRVR